MLFVFSMLTLVFFGQSLFYENFDIDMYKLPL